MPRLKSASRQRKFLGWRDSRTRADYIAQLAFGWDWFNRAWGKEVEPKHVPGEVLTDMRNCWALHRDEVEREFREHYGTHARYGRPWAWWLFDAPQPVDWKAPEAVRLWRLNLLSADDVRAAMSASAGGYEFNAGIARKYTTPAEQQLLGITLEGND